MRPIANSSLGIKHNDISRLNMSKAHLGIKMPEFTQEHKDRIRAGTRSTTNRKKKTVIAIDPQTGEELYRFTGSAALEDCGFARGLVGKVCKGLAKTHKKLIWKYVANI